MIATYKSTTRHKHAISNRAIATGRLTACDAKALASVKRRSKLLAVVDDVRVELQNAVSEQIRSYLYAICFRKLLTVAESQFDEEDKVGYWPSASVRLDMRTATLVAELRQQHASMLKTLREMLEMAEVNIEHVGRRVDSLHLLNRFWGFQKVLRQHESDEKKFLDVRCGNSILTEEDPWARLSS